jgi:hypothetical protein
MWGCDQTNVISPIIFELIERRGERTEKMEATLQPAEQKLRPRSS